MRKLGFILMIAGLVVVLGYSIYYFVIVSDIPLAIRVAVPAMLLGLILLLVSVVRERLEASKKETFKEIEK